MCSFSCRSSEGKKTLTGEMYKRKYFFENKNEFKHTSQTVTDSQLKAKCCVLGKFVEFRVCVFHVKTVNLIRLHIHTHTHVYKERRQCFS